MLANVEFDFSKNTFIIATNKAVKRWAKISFLKT